MFEKGTVVRYGQSGLCRIEDVSLLKIAQTEQVYYVLAPLFKTGSVLYVPCENEELVGRMLPPLSEDEVFAVISDVRERMPEWVRDFRRRSETSKKALSSGDRRDALYLIKNICFRKKEAVGEGKRIHTTDDYFLKDAENLIYNEFSFVLKKEYSEIAKLVQRELELV